QKIKLESGVLCCPQSHHPQSHHQCCRAQSSYFATSTAFTSFEYFAGPRESEYALRNSRANRAAKGLEFSTECGESAEAVRAAAQAAGKAVEGRTTASS